MNRQFGRVGCLMAGLASFFSSSPASAQNCIHGPLAVPGLEGPPVWFGEAGASDWRPELHDPRWAGAPVRLFTQSVTGIGDLYDGQYRVLHDGSSLYVSHQVLADSNTAATDSVDAVYFGFTDGPLPGNTGAYLVAIRPARSAAPVVAPHASVPQDATLPVMNANAQVSWFHTTDHTAESPVWTPHHQDIPVWLENVATWNGSPGVAWAVTFELNLAELGIDGTQQLFFGQRIGNGDGPTVKLGSTTITGDEAGSIGGGTVVLPDQDSWLEFAEAGSTCSGATIAPSDVAVYRDGSLTNELRACEEPMSCPSEGLTNTLRAVVRDLPSAVGFTDHAVRVKFRMADRGLDDWHLAPWRLVEGNSPSIVTDTDIADDPAWAYTFVPDEDEGSATVDFTCDAEADSYCPLLKNTDAHASQCLLVEIAAAPSAHEARFATGGAVICDLTYVGLNDAGAAGAGGMSGAGGSISHSGAGGAPGLEGGSGGASPSGDGGEPTASAGGSPAGGATASDGGTAGDAADRSEDGCGCRVAGAGERGGWAALWLLGAAWWRARRRAARHSS